MRVLSGPETTQLAHEGKVYSMSGFLLPGTSLSFEQLHQPFAFILKRVFNRARFTIQENGASPWRGGSSKSLPSPRHEHWKVGMTFLSVRSLGLEPDIMVRPVCGYNVVVWVL